MKFIIYIFHVFFQFLLFIGSEFITSEIYLKYYEIRRVGVSRGILFLYLFLIHFIIPSFFIINLINNSWIKVSIIFTVILLMLYYGIKIHPLQTMQYILCYLCSQLSTFILITRKVLKE